MNRSCFTSLRRLPFPNNAAIRIMTGDNLLQDPSEYHDLVPAAFPERARVIRAELNLDLS
jgi:hypothetical protein